jgi:hypothetical protein
MDCIRLQICRCVFLNFFLKKLFRIKNKKLYKLIVKNNYANKFLLNIKNKKIKLNNIHYKLNVFQKNNIKLAQWRSWRRRRRRRRRLVVP